MTDAAWCALSPEASGELVGGVLVEEEVPSWMHGAVITWLVAVLHRWIVPRGGSVSTEVSFVLGRGLGRKPDVAVCFPSSPMPPRTGPVMEPVDVFIEVISHSARDARRDRIEKAAEYAAFGVPWYWLIDPESRLFEIHELTPQREYVRTLKRGRGRVNRVPGCPGLKLDLDSLWRELDRLSRRHPAKPTRKPPQLPRLRSRTGKR